MAIDPNVAVSELVRSFPTAAEVLDRYAIDYCCGGTSTLGEACTRAGAKFEEVCRALDERLDAAPAHNPSPRDAGFDERDAGIPELISRLLDHHHVFTRQALTEIAPLMAAVICAHKRHHPILERVAALVEALRLEVEPHLLKEENLVFPQMLALSRRAAAGDFVETPLVVAVREPLRVMLLEHKVVGDLLHQLRIATGGFVAPADACPTWTRLYRWLAEFDDDLVRHMHLEDDRLFPLTEELQRRFEPAAIGAG
jgi:regulator of cell morphogenesis and NO signaling